MSLAGIWASRSPAHPQGVFAGISPATLIPCRSPCFYFSLAGSFSAHPSPPLRGERGGGLRPEHFSDPAALYRGLPVAIRQVRPTGKMPVGPVCPVRNGRGAPVSPSPNLRHYQSLTDHSGSGDLLSLQVPRRRSCRHRRCQYLRSRASNWQPASSARRGNMSNLPHRSRFKKVCECTRQPDRLLAVDPTLSREPFCTLLSSIIFTSRTHVAHTAPPRTENEVACLQALMSCLRHRQTPCIKT